MTFWDVPITRGDLAVGACVWILLYALVLLTLGATALVRRWWKS